MNETERLMLEGLWIRINRIPNRIEFEEKWLRKVENALAPANKEFDFKDSVNPNKSVDHDSYVEGLKDGIKAEKDGVTSNTTNKSENKNE